MLRPRPVFSARQRCDEGGQVQGPYSCVFDPFVGPPRITELLPTNGTNHDCETRFNHETDEIGFWTLFNQSLRFHVFGGSSGRSSSSCECEIYGIFENSRGIFGARGGIYENSREIFGERYRRARE